MTNQHCFQKNDGAAGLQLFAFEGQQVRTIIQGDEIWFAGKDVCEVFGDSNHRRSLGRVLEEDKTHFEIVTAGGKQNVIFINEAGLYDLLFSMRPERANSKGVQDAYPLETQRRIEKLHAFRRWVTHEVLPSIRKVGMYATPETAERLLQDPDFLIEVLQEIKAVRAKNAAQAQTINVQHQQIAEMRPKASYYDLVLNCKDAVAITTIAKDYGKSGQWLNSLLHDLGVQYKQGKIWLLYQKHAEQGYTVTKTHSYPGSDGEMHSKIHTYWTQKGRLFIYELLKREGILPLIEMEVA